MRSYKEILKDEIIMKNRYDGWTVKGMEEKLKEIEEKEKNINKTNSTKSYKNKP